MELTLDQALEKGVEAHKAGQVQEADRYYTAFLKAQPQHPDANHNMGVLAVGVGKVEQALPFFKTALEANPTIAQFWLSYIDALVKLDRTDDAKVVLAQAKDKGISGDGFAQLGEQINITSKNVNTLEPSKEPPQESLTQIVDFYSTGQYKNALDVVNQLLGNFPSYVTLYNMQGAINAALQNYDAAINSYQKAINLKPDYAEAYSNMG